MICNVCNGTGFINLHQIPKHELDLMSGNYHELIKQWISTKIEPHDVCVCTCCGDGESWYGDPGHHYGIEDPQGMDGPYAYNGGFCECH